MHFTYFLPLLSFKVHILVLWFIGFSAYLAYGSDFTTFATFVGFGASGFYASNFTGLDFGLACTLGSIGPKV